MKKFFAAVGTLCVAVCLAVSAFAAEYGEPNITTQTTMKELRENGYKKISLTAKSAIPEDFFSVPGTANLEWDKSKTSVSFMFCGPVMMIMNQLHRLELEDILIEEPSLEEVFLHYYE